jgi:hypothetical protein
MSGPVGTIDADSFRFMNVTQLYRFGVNVSSITIAAPTGGTPIANPDDLILGNGLLTGNTPDPKMTGPNASTNSWIGLAAALILATILIVALLAMDSKRR